MGYEVIIRRSNIRIAIIAGLARFDDICVKVVFMLHFSDSGP